MIDDLNSGFLVDVYSDPVIVKIKGRASFINSAPLQDFFHKLIEDGKTHFLMDFQKCTTMDSAFLGILAGVALNLRELQPAGSLIFSRLSALNLEEVKKLGLHKILIVDETTEGKKIDHTEELKGAPLNDQEYAKMVLQAHEQLCECDESNKERFQDVLYFLKNQFAEK